MAIMVQYKDNSFGNVRNEGLDSLIDGNAIVAFRRKSGWVEMAAMRFEAVACRVRMLERTGESWRLTRPALPVPILSIRSAGPIHARHVCHCRAKPIR